MLNIEPIMLYRVARYPKSGEYVSPPRLVGGRIRDLSALLALAATLESCGGGGPTSGVPLPGDIVSEAEARQLISDVFVADSIQLTADRPVIVHTGLHDSVSVVMDGYNDSLKVGYDYVTEDDSDATVQVLQALDSTKYTQAPHILTVGQAEMVVGYGERMQAEVRQFLDSLRAHGII